MNLDEPGVIMTKIREETDGRGNKSGICGDFPLEADRCGRHPLGSGGGHPAGTGTRQGRAPGRDGHPAGTG